MVGLIKWGTISAAGDITMSAIIRQLDSRTRAAIIELISPIAADIIASSPTVEAAAAAAVDAALADTLALAKCVHREAGAWVWDGPNGTAATHYVLPDDTGALVVRPTPFPIPDVSPSFTW